MKKTCYIQSFYTYQIFEGYVKYHYMLQYIIDGVITNVRMDEERYTNYSTYTDSMYKLACEYHGKNLGDDYHIEQNHYCIK